jgi:two-component system OmpR family response regulator
MKHPRRTNLIRRDTTDEPAAADHAVMRVLLLEDDARLGPLLARGLRGAGHAVDLAETVEDARWLASVNPYEVLVLDVVVPDGDARDLVAELRAEGNWTPCLLLTALGGTDDRVRGLDVGADDYVVKPFELDELLARMRAVGRRGPTPRPTSLQVGRLVVDPAARRATVAGAAVPLSSLEFALLELLARRQGEVLDRAAIRDHVWDWAYEAGSNVVDVHVHALRAKLAAFPGAPPIETVRGAGYVLRTPGPGPGT